MKRSLLLFFILMPIFGFGQGQQWQGAATQLNGWHGGVTANKFMRAPHAKYSFTWFDSSGRYWYDSATTKSFWFNDGIQDWQFVSKKDTDYIKSFIAAADTGIYVKVADSNITYPTFWYLLNNYFSRSQSDARYLQSFTEIDPVSFHKIDSNNYGGAITFNYGLSHYQPIGSYLTSEVDPLSIHTILKVYPDTNKLGSQATLLGMGKAVPTGIYTNGLRGLIQDTNLNNNTVYIGNTDHRTSLKLQSNNTMDLFLWRTDPAAGPTNSNRIFFEQSSSTGGEIQGALLAYHYSGDGQSNKGELRTFIAGVERADVSDHLAGFNNPLVVGANSTTSTYVAPAMLAVQNNNSGIPVAQFATAPGQTVDNTQWFNPSGIKTTWISASGNLHAPTVSITGDTVISGNIIVDTLTNVRQKQFFDVNTSSGNVAITLKTNNFTVGRPITVTKNTSDNNTVTITPTSGTILNQSSYTISLVNQAVTFRLNSQGNWERVSNTSDNGGSGHVNLTDFGVVKDWARLSGLSMAKGSKHVTSSSPIFINTDVGKCLYVMNARTAYWYCAAPLTLMSIVDTVISTTEVVIRHAADTTATNTTGYYFTNNADQLYNVAIFCRNNKRLQVQDDQAGIGGIAPQFSQMDTITANNRGIPLYGDISWNGASMNNSIFKICIEDSISTNLQGYQFNMFVIMNSGKKSISNFTILAPDREDIKFVKQEALVGIRANLLPDSINGNFIGTNLAFIGDSTGGWRDWRRQWTVGYSNSAPCRKGWFQTNMYNFIFQCDYQGVEVHGDTSKTKGLDFENFVIQGTGSKRQVDTLTNCVNITAGSNIVTITGQPYFSKYNFRSGDDHFDTSYVMVFYDGTHIYQDTMYNLNGATPNVFTIRHNSPYTFINATIAYRDKESMSYEGHGMYINPGVNSYMAHGLWIDNPKLCTQFQSSGGINPNPDFRVFVDCKAVTGPDGFTTRGFLIDHQTPGLVDTIIDCENFPLYSLGQPLTIYAKGSYLGPTPSFYGKTILIYCRAGDAFFSTGAHADTVLGGFYNSVQVYPTTTGSVTCFGVTTKTPLNNISTLGATLASYCGTAPGTPTGAGTTNVYPCSGAQALADTSTYDATKANLNTAQALDIKYIDTSSSWFITKSASNTLFATKQNNSDTGTWDATKANLNTAIAGLFADTIGGAGSFPVFATNTSAILNGGNSLSDTMRIFANNSKNIIIGINATSRIATFGILNNGRFQYNFTQTAGTGNRFVLQTNNGANMTNGQAALLFLINGQWNGTATGSNTMFQLKPYYFGDGTTNNCAATITLGGGGEDFRFTTGSFNSIKPIWIGPTSIGGTFNSTNYNTKPTRLFTIDNTGGTTTDTGFIMKAVTSQTAPFLSIQNSSGTQLVGIDVTGNVITGGVSGNTFKWMANTTAPGTSTVTLPTTIHGSGSALLGEPTQWLYIDYNGTLLKIAAY